MDAWMSFFIAMCVLFEVLFYYTQLNQNLSTRLFGNITSAATQGSVSVKGKYLIDENVRQ